MRSSFSLLAAAAGGKAPAAAAAAAAAPPAAAASNLTYGSPGAFQSATSVLLRGTGSDWSIFREVPFLIRVARSSLRLLKWTAPGVAGLTWYFYPALTPNFKKESGLPF